MPQIFPQIIESKIEKADETSGWYNIEVICDEETFEAKIHDKECVSKIIEIDQIPDLINRSNLNPKLKYEIEYEIDYHDKNMKSLSIIMQIRFKPDNLKEIIEEKLYLSLSSTSDKPINKSIDKLLSWFAPIQWIFCIR